jgi:hypothetical protein
VFKIHAVRTASSDSFRARSFVPSSLHAAGRRRVPSVSLRRSHPSPLTCLLPSRGPTFLPCPSATHHRGPTLLFPIGRSRLSSGGSPPYHIPRGEWWPPIRGARAVREDMRLGIAGRRAASDDADPRAATSAAAAADGFQSDPFARDADGAGAMTAAGAGGPADHHRDGTETGTHLRSWGRHC